MRIFLMLIALTLLLFGCSFTKDVVYKVRGSAVSADLTYENASGGTSQISAAPLPWQTSFTVSPTSSSSVFLYISAQNTGSSGDVTAEIYVDGAKTKSTTSSGAYVIATASDSLGGY